MSDLAPIEERPTSDGPRPPRTRPSRPDRPSGRARWLVRVGVAAAVFIVGLVIGMAIQDRPRPGGEQTIVNTLRVSTLAPVETVTVTVQSP